MNDLESRIRRALEEQSASLELREVRMTTPRPFGLAIAGGVVALVLLAVTVGAPVLLPGVARPAQVASPIPAASAGTPSRLGPSSTVCAVAAGKAGLAASFVEGSDTLARCQLLISADNGRTWVRHLEEESVVALAVDPVASVVYAGTVSGSIWRYSSKQWERIYNSPVGAFQPVITKLLIDGSRVFATGRALLVSQDGGAWRDATAGLGNTPTDISRRGRFGIGDLAPVGGTVAVLVSDFVPEAGIWLYELDSGQWRRAQAVPDSAGIRAVTGHNSALIVGTGSGRVWSSTDLGRSWIDDTKGLESRQVAVFTKSSSQLFAGTDLGAFVRGSDRWEPVGTTKPRFVRAVAVIDGAALLGAEVGLWRVPLR